MGDIRDLNSGGCDKHFRRQEEISQPVTMTNAPLMDSTLAKDSRLVLALIVMLREAGSAAKIVIRQQQTRGLPTLIRQNARLSFRARSAITRPVRRGTTFPFSHLKPAKFKLAMHTRSSAMWDADGASCGALAFLPSTSSRPIQAVGMLLRWRWAACVARLSVAVPATTPARKRFSSWITTPCVISQAFLSWDVFDCAHKFFGVRGAGAQLLIQSASSLNRSNPSESASSRPMDKPGESQTRQRAVWRAVGRELGITPHGLWKA